MASAQTPTALPEDGALPSAVSPVRLTPSARSSGGSPFARVVVSELRLLLKGQRWWWYSSAAGLLVGQFASPDRGVRSWFLAFAWIWPFFQRSQMGGREARHGTTSLLSSSEHNLSRQLPALWTAGVLVIALATGAGVGLRLFVAGDWHRLAAWLAGAFFIPSLALVLGIWSGGSKTFEAIYTGWWYMGPAHQFPRLDLMGTTTASSSPAVYALSAAVLLTAAYWCRGRSLSYA